MLLELIRLWTSWADNTIFCKQKEGRVPSAFPILLGRPIIDGFAFLAASFSRVRKERKSISYNLEYSGQEHKCY